MNSTPSALVIEGFDIVLAIDARRALSSQDAKSPRCREDAWRGHRAQEHFNFLLHSGPAAALLDDNAK